VDSQTTGRCLSIPTVALAANLSGTSIGEGFRPVPRKLTYTDLSRTIDSWNARERFTAPQRDTRSAPELKAYQTP